MAKQQERFTLSCLLLMAKQSDTLHTPHKVQGQLRFAPSDLQSGLELFLSSLCLGRILYQQSQFRPTLQTAENKEEETKHWGTGSIHHCIMLDPSSMGALHPSESWEGFVEGHRMAEHFTLSELGPVSFGKMPF